MDGDGEGCLRLYEQVRPWVRDRVVESHRKNGYGLNLSKKRYEQAVAQVAAIFRGLTDASKGRAA